MDDFVECPFCGILMETGEENEVHVSAHLNEDHARGSVAGASGMDGGTVSMLGALDSMICPTCGSLVPLTDLTSHEEAHRLQQMEQEHRAAARQEESRQFQALQQKYGFASSQPAQRTGKCYHCGQEGHWQSDCPTNPNRISAMPRLPADPSQLVAWQRREAAALAGSDVVGLLKGCLEAEGRPHLSSFLCGYAAHLSRSSLDSGWGCGYRNLQMLASHLLAQRPDVRDVLFGGCGWLPDIPSLQAWLEAGWGLGFDPPGRRQLGGEVQGTRKWIGTPEVAVVLRQFGIDARIVDFCAQGNLSSNASGATIHHGVACDLCGACPIVGVRHKSTLRSDFDVCSRCEGSPAARAASPYIPLGAGGCAGGGGIGGGAEGAAGGLQRQQLPPSGSSAGEGGDGLGAAEEPEGLAGAGGGRPGGWQGRGASAAGAQQQQQHRHRALVQWVWDYFSSASPQEIRNGAGGSGSSSGGGGGGAAAPARLRSSPVTVTRRAPLYLQHEGHSRTVVGVERYWPPGREAQYRLLILDPGVGAQAVRESLSSRQHWQRRVKRGLHTLQRPEFQVLYVPEDVPPAPRGSQQWEALKRIAAADRIFS